MAASAARPPAEAVAIVGPTAAGKTALSVAVARRLDAEVISMDSRQVYRGMDVGTAKASAEQRAAVVHHSLDLVEPDARFTAGNFARLARRLVPEIRARGNVPLLVGGTGFYLRALTRPLFTEPPLDRDRRRLLGDWLGALDDATLRRWLASLDPPTALRLSRSGGRQRLLRALELPLLTGRPLSWYHARPTTERPLPLLVFVLVPERAALRAAIDARVDDMAAAGLVDEVRSLVRQGYRAGDPGMSATGYAELLPFLAGETTLEEAFEQVRANTWRYARRQLTWFRHQLPADAVRLDAARPNGDLAEEIAEAWHINSRVPVLSRPNAKPAQNRADPGARGGPSEA
ncbi:MAG: tRNA (adenosine(37)-N6)-dimethylallyltransferase MiaA [Longimicrobiaceae bacterium]